MVVSRGFRMGETFVEVAFQWLSAVVSGWGKIFAEVSIHWLSAVVSGWEKKSQKSQFIGYQPWFPDGKKFAEVAIHWLSTVVSGWGKIFAEVSIHWLSTVVSGWKKIRRGSNSLVVNRGFRMGEDFRRGRIRFFSPSPPHDFPCPFRIAIGLDTCLEALPTDSGLDSTSPARQTGGGCQLPTVSASPRTASLRLWLPAVRTTEGPASTLGSSEIGSDKVILLHKKGTRRSGENRREKYHGGADGTRE